MALLPQFNTKIVELSLMQSAWTSIINVLLRNPSLQSQILDNISLSTGSNTVNHGLGRKLKGWRIIRKSAASDIYDSQANNQRQDLTLILIASAPCTLSLEVF